MPKESESATAKEILKALAEPFPPEDIEWRVGQASEKMQKGLALAYLTARACMDRLDSAVGPANWQDEYRREASAIFCRLGLFLPSENGAHRWVYREDAAEETDIEAVKGGVSSAFKRAGVKFGIGRYLYHLKGEWLPVREKYRTRQGKIVWDFVSTPTLPNWALPGGSGKPDPAAPAPPPPPPEPASPPSEHYMGWVEAIDQHAENNDRDALAVAWGEVVEDRDAGILTPGEAGQLQHRMRKVGKEKGWTKA